MTHVWSVALSLIVLSLSYSYTHTHTHTHNHTSSLFALTWTDTLHLMSEHFHISCCICFSAGSSHYFLFVYVLFFTSLIVEKTLELLHYMQYGVLHNLNHGKYIQSLCYSVLWAFSLSVKNEGFFFFFSFLSVSHGV